MFVDAGFDDVFIAYPLWVGRRPSPPSGGRSPTGPPCASGSTRSRPPAGWPARGSRALVEVDCGHHRSGVLPAEAGRLASDVAASGLDVLGVFTFPGPQLRPDGGRERAAADEAQALTDAAASLAGAGCRARSS